MKFTNNFNLPQDVFKACAAEQFEPNLTRIGVTSLIAPAHIRQLTIQHWDEIKIDAATRLWAVLGEGCHLVMDKYNPDKGGEKRKFEFAINGITVVGIIDSFDAGIITDYKVTSVYSFLSGLKAEWEAQLNLYAWLLNKHNIEVKGLRINAILRDWVISKARYGYKMGAEGGIENWGNSLQSDYPSIPFQSIEASLWSLEKTKQFVKNRLAAHQKCGIICNEDERWQRPTIYAVMKKGRKTAMACNNYRDGKKTPFTKEDAEKWILENQEKGQSLYIEKRPGGCVRCESYCSVKQFCEFGKNLEVLK